MEVSRLRSGRLSEKKKTYPTTSWHRPLSARNGHQSHPLDKLRPAGASSGGWTEGPMAPVETTDAATVDQRCSFKHQTGWRHNHSNSKLCVALRMGQANLLSITNCHPCAGACSLHAQFSRQLDLCVSSLSREPRVLHRGKKTLICACHPCASHTSVSFKKKNYPSQILTVILVQGPCSNIQSHTICVQKPCNSVQKKKLRHPCARGHATVSSGK